MSAIMRMIEIVVGKGDAGAEVSEIIQESGVELYDGMYILRSLINDGILRKAESGRIVSGDPKSHQTALRFDAIDRSKRD